MNSLCSISLWRSHFHHYRPFLPLALMMGLGRISYLWLFWLLSHILSLEVMGLVMLLLALAQIMGMLANLGSAQAAFIIIPQLRENKHSYHLKYFLLYAALLTFIGIMLIFISLFLGEALALKSMNAFITLDDNKIEMLIKGLLWLGPIWAFSALREAIARGYEAPLFAILPKDVLWPLSLIIIIFIMPHWLHDVTRLFAFTLLGIELIAAMSLYMRYIRPELSTIKPIIREGEDEESAPLRSTPPIASWTQRALFQMMNAVGSQIFERIDIIAIALFGGLKAAAIYGIASRIAPIISLCQRFIIPITMPKIARLFAKEEEASLRSTLIWKEVKIGLSLSVIIAGGLSLFMIIFAPFIMTLFGAEYGEGSLILRILALAHFIIALGSNYSAIITATSVPFQATRNIWVALIFSIGAMIILTPLYDIYAIAYAMLMGIMLCNGLHVYNAIQLMSNMSLTYSKTPR